MNNAQIAAAFDELADLYELDGAVQYRVLAYRTAARTVREASVSVAQLLRDGRVTELPGIGKTLETKLQALVETGDTPQAQELRGLRGFGAKVEEKLLEQLAEGVDGRPEPRVLLSRALPVAEQIADALRAAPGADRVEVAGSLRRRADSVKDLDIVAT